MAGLFILTGLIITIGYVLDVWSHSKPPIRVDCANNLRQIGLGLHMYSGDHQSTFPDTFIALKPYVKKWDLFVCPKHEHEVDNPLTWNEIKRYGSYYYIAGLNENGDTDRVHAFELPSNHEDHGANILHSGGYVQWHRVQGPSNEAFWAVLALSGITKEVIDNATNRIIRAEDLVFPREEETQ